VRALPHTGSCFVCGESNPGGLKLRFETDGRVVQSRFRPLPAHVGFKQTVHGGIIAAVLDEIMVWACAVGTRRFGYCAELNVRFLSPLRPGEEVLVTGELVSNRKNKILEARAELRDNAGAVLASATGKYLPLKEAQLPELLEEFVGGDAGLFLPVAGS
jgi:acyl-coenzyme A thioesterase PaaI-like protein